MFSYLIFRLLFNFILHNFFRFSFSSLLISPPFLQLKKRSPTVWKSRLANENNFWVYFSFNVTLILSYAYYNSFQAFKLQTLSNNLWGIFIMTFISWQGHKFTFIYNYWGTKSYDRLWNNIRFILHDINVFAP